MKIRCILFGHRRYAPWALQDKSYMTLRDQLNAPLVNINICKVCGDLYTDLIKNQNDTR